MDAEKPKSKRFLKLVLVNLFFLVLILYGFELALYCQDPVRKLPVNGLQKDGLYTWGHLVKNNSYGFREKEFAVPAPEGIYRIMVLGDSLTWGAGLAPERRYSNLMEKYLTEKFPGKKFEVLNFGLSGGPTILERDNLRRYKDVVKPDLIVVGFCLNDPQPKGQDYSLEKEEFDKKYANVFYGLNMLSKYAKLSRISARAKQAIYNIAESRKIIPTWQTALDRTYDKNSNEWREFEQALRDLKSMSNEMQLPVPYFAVLNQGTKGSDKGLNYVEPDEKMKQFLGWYHQAEKMAEEIGFKTVDFEKEIVEQLYNDNLAVNAADGHPSAKLNEVYARKLFEIMNKNEAENDFK